jgi:hypothetical protein
MGFSPYELHLRSGMPTQVGLIAGVKDDTAFSSAMKALESAKSVQLLSKEGIGAPLKPVK